MEQVPPALTGLHKHTSLPAWVHHALGEGLEGNVDHFLAGCVLYPSMLQSIHNFLMQGTYIQWLRKSSLWPCNHSNVRLSGITYLHNTLSGTNCVASPSMCLKTGKEGSMCMSPAAVALYSALHSIVHTYIAPVHYLL